MSYRHTSNQSGDASQSRVRTFLVERGFIVLEPNSRDAIYDYVVDCGGGIFETVQVKTLQGNKLAKRVRVLSNRFQLVSTKSCFVTNIQGD